MKNIDWDRDATSTAFDLTTFKKQSEAFKYADMVNIARSARNERPMLVFSREISNEGHRYFIVDDVDSFYEKYILVSGAGLYLYPLNVRNVGLSTNCSCQKRSGIVTNFH